MLQNVVNHIAMAERMEHLERQAVEQRLRRQVRQARRAARRRALLWHPPNDDPGPQNPRHGAGFAAQNGGGG